MQNMMVKVVVDRNRCKIFKEEN